MQADTLPFVTGETPVSYCSRLAHYAGYASANAFCTDLGTTFWAVRDGRAHVMRLLAERAEVSVSDLTAKAIVIKSDGLYRLGRHILGTDQIDRLRVRVCPACLRDDITAHPELGVAAAIQRAEWRVSPIQSCKVHGLRLVDLVPPLDESELSFEARMSRLDFTRLLSRMLPKLDRMVSEAERRPADPLELYLLNRLAGKRDSSVAVLNRRPFYLVHFLCEKVGAVEIHGEDVRFGSLDVEQRRAATLAGFELFHDKAHAERREERAWQLYDDQKWWWRTINRISENLGGSQASVQREGSI